MPAAAKTKHINPVPDGAVDGAAVSRPPRTHVLEQFYIAPENARQHSAASIDELAENIAAFGLLQELVGYVDDHGRVAICDGGRRFRALVALSQRANRGESDAAINALLNAIPFKEIDQAAAYAASLAANTMRVDLGIVEAAEAWSAMAVRGMDTPTIARVFGVTERFVASRLALAGLYAPILEALREGAINLDVAQVYATAKVARQEQTWKKLGKKASRWEIQRELQRDTLRAGDALARFVGEDAYVAAGGVVERELFAKPEDSRWLQPDLARDLADKKLAAAKAEVEAEGFKFVEAAHEFAYGQFTDANAGKPRKPTDEEKAELAAIKAKLKALDKEERAIDDACDKEDRQYTEAEDDRYQAIGDERIDLQAAAARIEAELFTYDEAAKQRTGVAISIDDDTGGLLIQRGVVLPKERKAVKAGAAAKKGKSGSGKAGTPEPQAPMTNLTHERLSRIASAQVGRALAGNTQVALAALAALLARDVFHELVDGRKPTGEEALTIKGALAEPVTGEGDTLRDDKDHEIARKRWIVALGDGAGGWDEKIAAWPQADVLDLLAFCVGASVKVVETNAARDYGKYDGRHRLAVLGRLASATPTTYVASLEVLQGMSRPTLDAAAAELGIDSAGAKTKAALAAMIADRVEQAAWAPPLLYTLTGATRAATPAPAEAPKRRGRPPGVKTGEGKTVKQKAAKAKKLKKAVKAAPKAVSK